MGFKPDAIIGNIKDKHAQIQELQILVRQSRNPQERMSREIQIARTKQEIENLKAEWLSRNPGKPFPV